MQNKKLAFVLLGLIFLNGYISLSLELVILRQLGFYVGSSAVITSIIMGTFLGFMSLGYFLGSSKKISNGKIRRILGASFIVIAIFSFLAASFPLVTNYFTWLYRIGATRAIAQTFIYSFAMLSIGPFLFGFNTTLLSRALHEHNTNYTGTIMAWDTIGSVLGSLLTTLILMPFIGVNYTVATIAILACTCAILSWPRVWIIMASLLILAPTMYINSNKYQHNNFGILVNNANSTISVSQYPDMRILNMNGLPMSVYVPATGMSAEYINYINDNFLYTMPNDHVRKILVLGAGGFTAGLRDEYNDYTFVDIEHTLKDISEEKFLQQKLTPNKKFIVQDAGQFLKNTSTKYDVILLDVYSNSFQIPEAFITAEFMERIKSRIAPGGIVIMNVIATPNFADNFSCVFDNTFHAVFPTNTTRQVIGNFNPWVAPDTVNIIYVYYNNKNNNRIYTTNKTPVIYDRY